MKSGSLVAIALAIIMATAFPSAIAQDNSKVRVDGAYVILVENGDPVSERLFAGSGSPYQLRNLISTTESLFSIDVPQTVSDQEGRFSFELPIKNGSYNITAHASGYVFIPSDTTNLVVSENKAESVDSIILSMRPSAVVTGRVLDESEKPVSGVIVSVGDPRNAANYDVTLDDGVFVLDTNLMTGNYDIHAFKPDNDFANIFSEIDVSSFPASDIMVFDNLWNTFSDDGKGWISTVSNVTLVQGKLTTLNMRLEESHTISGRVADVQGNPIEGLPVFAFDGDGKLANTLSVTDAQGTYILDNDLSPGSYKVIIPWPFNKGYIPSSIDVTIAPHDNSSEANLVLDSSKSIIGKVVDANGQGVSNATIIAISKTLIESDLGNDVPANDLKTFLSSGITTAVTGADGKYLLNGTIDSGTYLVSASFGDIAPAGSLVEADVADNVADLEDIVLDFNSLVSVSGSVTDSEGLPISGAEITPSFSIASMPFATPGVKTDAGGRFVMVIPFKGGDAGVASMLDEVTVSADGHLARTVKMGEGENSILLEKADPVKISGMVIADEHTTQLIETLLTRKGAISFEHSQNRYPVGVETNSRILETDFDQPNKRIVLQIEGVHNSDGSLKIHLPKEFLAGPFVVIMDDTTLPPESYAISENQTHSLIDLRYSHSQHKIIIQGTTAVPEFPLPAVLTAVAFVMSIVLVGRARFSLKP